MRQLLAEIRGRLSALLFGAREDAELREEMAFHVAMEAQLRQEEGDALARRNAQLAFGSRDRWIEESRDARGVRALTDFGQDVRLAVREMRRRPGFTAVAVLTLGIGIAAVTAAFSVANRVLLAPLPGVVAPEQLTTVLFQRDVRNFTGISYLNLRDLQSQVPAFAALVGQTHPRDLQTRMGNGRGTVIVGQTVAGDYFGMLGLTPAQGRFFLPEEDNGRTDGRRAVISHHLWQQRYAGAALRGATIELNGATFEIIGVAPAGFEGTQRFSNVAVWLPAAAHNVLNHMTDDALEARDVGAFFVLLGRLRAGATVEQAERQLTAATDRLIAAYPDENGKYRNNRPRVHAGVGLLPATRGGAIPVISILFGAALLVLLITCANVANLLLFRALRARGETAVRRALGASTWRVVQHHTAQGLMLALAGSAVALVLVAALVRAFGTLPLPMVGSVNVTVDVRVLGFTLLVALVTAVLFAAVPTLLSQRLPLLDNLRAAGRAETGRTGSLRRALVVFQLALSAAMVVPAVLLARSVSKLAAVELGFDPANVMLFGVNPQPQGYDRDQVAAFRRRLLEAVRARPEFAAAAVTSAPPFGGMFDLSSISGPLQGQEGDGVDTYIQWVSGDYFATLGMIEAGAVAIDVKRPFDATAPGDGVVLSRAAALAVFGSDQVVGRTVREDGFNGERELRVTHVLSDMRVDDLREQPGPVIYRPMTEARSSRFYVVVRTRVSRAQTEMIVGDLVAAIDPAIPFFQADLLSNQVRGGMLAELMLARMTRVLGALAALLAAVALYSLMAYVVAQRTREIGIRMALGARVSRIVTLVTRESAKIVLTGVILGALGGWALARVLRAQLFGVTELDPLSYMIAGAFFGLIALIASAVPARHAARVQPAAALRHE